MLDAKGRVARAAVTGLLPVDYAYDTDGRLRTVTQGARQTSWTYDGQGHVERVREWAEAEGPRWEVTAVDGWRCSRRQLRNRGAPGVVSA